MGTDLDHHEPGVVKFSAVFQLLLPDHGVDRLDHSVKGRFHDILVKAPFDNVPVSPMFRPSLSRDDLQAKNIDGDISKHFGRPHKDGWLVRDVGRDSGGRGDVDGIVGGRELGTGEKVGLVVIVLWNQLDCTFQGRELGSLLFHGSSRVRALVGVM